MSHKEEGGYLVDIWVFLDCILNVNFKELEIHAAFPDTFPSVQLIPTITKHSPLLQKLSINFKLMKKADDQKKEEQLRQFIQSLVSLVNLKELRLFGLSPTERYLVLTLIGKSCPSLTHLYVNGAKMCKKDILALVLGEFINDLYDSEEEPSWCEDGGVETLVIPSEFRTQICFTLQELHLIKEESSRDIESAAAICPITAAFTVSNFPLLVKVDKRIPINIGTGGSKKRAKKSS